MGALDVKPVSLICKMLLQAAVSYSGSHKIWQRQTLSWDCPFNSGKSKQLNFESKVLEDINRAYSGPPIHAQFSQAYAKTT
jgi:hypothetical protein